MVAIPSNKRYAPTWLAIPSLYIICRYNGSKLITFSSCKQLTFNVSRVADREPEDDITHYDHTSQLVSDCEMSDSWPRGTRQLTASEYGVLLDELDRLQLLQDTSCFKCMH